MMQMAGRNAVPLHIPARYMVVSIMSLIGWIVLTPWMLPDLIAAPLSYPVIAWTHLLTLGCIGSMIIGASVQLVPVALQNPFPATTLAEWSWFVWLAGITLFEIGFSQEIPGLLAPGATLIGVVLLGYALAITTMFRRSPARDAVAWYLLAASWLAIIGFILGWLLALTNVNGALGGQLLPILAAHIIVMIVGWVSLTLIGVGYKLIGMFTLAERALDQSRAKIAGFLIVAGTLLMMLTISFSGTRMLMSLGAGFIAWGVIMAALEINRMYQKRMRKAIDVHMPFAIVAVLILLMSAITLVALTFDPNPLGNRFTIATVWLVLTGTILVAIQGFFYKISTFLIWLRTYSPLAGKVAVPQLDTMYDRNLAYTGLIAWMWSVIAISAVLLDLLTPWWGWSAGLWIGGLLFAINVVRIGRHWRGPVALKTPAIATQLSTKH